MKNLYKLSILSAIFSLIFSLSVSSQNAWINEIHYSDSGIDTNEFIEVIIDSPGNFTLSSFDVLLYNGNNGEIYDTKSMDLFTEGVTFEMYKVYYYMYPTNGIQNGEPDGVALAYNDVLIPGQFLSYEGSFTGVGGPADGITSVDIGVLEGGEPDGSSLQLAGQGSDYLNFTWQPPAEETHGELNNNQDLLPVGIAEPAAYRLSIYPNPNQGIFSINNPSESFSEISLYSINGQVVTKKILAPGVNEMRWDDVVKGVYFIKSEQTPELILPIKIIIN